MMRSLCSSIDVYGFSLGTDDRNAPYHYYDKVTPSSEDRGRWLPQKRLLEIIAICQAEDKVTFRLGATNVTGETLGKQLPRSVWASACSYNGLF
eukprot:scaffold6585_cov403-Prasinococcus_capsulatus_cf.AAC.4